ncbi:MAG: glycosyltransferase [Bacteroidaceae bacterium]|nr:glycosyltransferase [Bacteroidaceae bacterium]
MLSILIPTYNYNALKLVKDLYDLAKKEYINFEIIVGDDASTEECEWLEEAKDMPRVRVIHNKTNEGRALTSNKLAKNAKGSWLLIIDSDAQVGFDFSFMPYLQATRKAKVVCGGLRTPAENPNPKGTLRYKYERRADKHRLAAQRSAHPNRQLSTFNLLIQTEVFNSIGGFDERCRQYGYEDVQLGIMLEERGINVTHIDNPLIHMGIDSNEEFLSKTEMAIQNLHLLQGKLMEYSALVQTAKKIKKMGLHKTALRCYRYAANMMRRNILGNYPSLTVFQLYKLGYFMSLDSEMHYKV